MRLSSYAILCQLWWLLSVLWFTSFHCYHARIFATGHHYNIHTLVYQLPWLLSYTILCYYLRTQLTFIVGSCLPAIALVVHKYLLLLLYRSVCLPAVVTVCVLGNLYLFYSNLLVQFAELVFALEQFQDPSNAVTNYEDLSLVFGFLFVLKFFENWSNYSSLYLDTIQCISFRNSV